MNRTQSFFVVLFLTLALSLSAMVSWLVRSPLVTQAAESSELRRFVAGGAIFMNRGSFIDFEDRMLFEKLPKADFSRPATFLFGTSTSKWALAEWDLSEQQRQRLYNFGFGASSHRQTRHFIEHLIANEGVLQGSGAGSEVILGCFWTLGQPWPNGFFQQFWSRYGLYTYDDKLGLSIAPMPDWKRAWISERARWAGFIEVNLRRLMLSSLSAVGMNVGANGYQMPSRAELRRTAVQLSSDPNWERGMNEQFNELTQTIRTLRARGAVVKLVLWPTHDVYDDRAPAQAYAEGLRRIAAAEGVELKDWSKMLKADEFVDLHHANYAGQKKLTPAFAEWALKPDR